MVALVLMGLMVVLSVLSISGSLIHIFRSLSR
jgi:hypothetical protein